MKKQNRMLPLFNAIFAAIFLLLTDAIDKIEQIVSMYTGVGQNTVIITTISGISLTILLWLISRIGLFVYDELFFKKLGLGGSKRGTYMYLALQKISISELNNIKSNKEELVRILGIFYIDDRPQDAIINYAEAYYWDGKKKFSRRGSWSSLHVKTDLPNKLAFIYKIKVDCNEEGQVIPKASKWLGTLEMERQSGNKDSLVLGIEAWRGVSEGKNFESAFYCERLTLDTFLPAEKVHKMLNKQVKYKKLALKLPMEV